MRNGQSSARTGKVQDLAVLTTWSGSQESRDEGSVVGGLFEHLSGPRGLFDRTGYAHPNPETFWEDRF